MAFLGLKMGWIGRKTLKIAGFGLSPVTKQHLPGWPDLGTPAHPVRMGIIQPKVGRNADYLGSTGPPNVPTLKELDGFNPFRVGYGGPTTQGSAFRATLG